MEVFRKILKDKLLDISVSARRKSGVDFIAINSAKATIISPVFNTADDDNVSSTRSDTL